MRFEQLSQARQAPDLDRMDGADDQQLEEADDQQLGGVDDQRQQVALRLVRFMFVSGAWWSSAVWGGQLRSVDQQLTPEWSLPEEQPVR